jgi:hypothetical protein
MYVMQPKLVLFFLGLKKLNRGKETQLGQTAPIFPSFVSIINQTLFRKLRTQIQRDDHC